jgi:hypothetical protein
MGDSCDVLHSMALGTNTAVVVDSRGAQFRKGIEIKDKHGQTYKLSSGLIDFSPISGII